jgi:hypothetical protein
MAITVGGIYVMTPATRLANDVCSRLDAVAGPWKEDDQDYLIDLAFLTYEADGLGAELAAGTGIRPGPVGRTQRRFIIWIEVPPKLADEATYNDWMTGCLSEAATIVRQHLPRKSKAYPAEDLALELDHLKDRWIASVQST